MTLIPPYKGDDLNKELFDAMDVNGNGYIEVDDFSFLKNSIEYSIEDSNFAEFMIEAYSLGIFETV